MSAKDFVNIELFFSCMSKHNQTDTQTYSHSAFFEERFSNVNNIYIDNVYADNVYVNNVYVKNVYVDNVYVDNVFVDNVYVHNLYVYLDIVYIKMFMLTINNV